MHFCPAAYSAYLVGHRKVGWLLSQTRAQGGMGVQLQRASEVWHDGVQENKFERRADEAVALRSLQSALVKVGFVGRDDRLAEASADARHSLSLAQGLADRVPVGLRDARLLNFGGQRKRLRVVLLANQWRDLALADVAQRFTRTTTLLTELLSELLTSV